MRTLRFLSLFFLLATMGQQAFGQRLLIQYDFLKDDFKYFTVSTSGHRKALSKPVVSRNHNVKVEVINYNPFLYSATANFSNEKIVEAPNLGFLGLVSPLSLPTGGSDFLQQLVGEDGTRGVDGVMANQKAKVAYKAIEQTYTTLYQAEQMMNSIDFVLSKVHKLKYNPYLPADTIKRFSQELINTLFDDPQVETKDFLVKSNIINSAVKGRLANFKQNVQQFMEAYNEVAEEAEGDYFEGKGLNLVVQDYERQVTSFVNSFDSDLLVEKLDELESLYQSIMNTPYVFNANEVATGDKMNIVIAVYRNPEASEGGSVDYEDLQMVKQKEMTVTVKGDIKISSSLGVAFPYYSDNNEYINRDSVITSVAGNNFTPNFAAYLNFYPYTGNNVQWGGTFGVGVPISADSKNFSFLLGLSTSFGTDNKIVLNYGATLGQVKRLDRGYSVSDRLSDGFSEVPTREAYEWGAFIGVSFNIANIKD